MSRYSVWVKILLGSAVLISLAAGIRDVVNACHACSSSAGLPIALAGALFYAVLFLTAFFYSVNRFVTYGIMATAGVHATLVGFMILTGVFCPLCILAAANSMALLALSLTNDVQNRRRAAAILPLTIGLSVAMLILLNRTYGFPLPQRQTLAETEGPAEDPSRPVRIVVFEKPGCPHCHELRTLLIPSLENEFRSRIELVYRDSSNIQGVVNTPTIVIVGSSKVIEGLPSYEELREAVAAMVQKKKLPPVSRR